MSYTIVTAFVLQTRDTNNSSKIDEYMKRFEYIKQLNIPTILFLDDTLKLQETDTLKIVQVSLKDTWIYKLYKDTNAILPTIRNTDKDTCEYMMIQNSKAEWLTIASQLNSFNTEYFVWIDFGISHVIKHKNTFNILKTLKLTNDIYIGAISHTSHNDLMERICWRFAGGIVIIKRSHIKLFYETCQHVIQQIFPRITWEVNIWCIVEKMLNINVYYADHNDTLLLNINPT